MNSRKVGDFYEKIACEYLTENEAEVVERNFRCKFGEVDIIIRDGEYLAFVEVKYRNSNYSGRANEAVHHKKQRIISKCANCYCMLKNLGQMTAIRFDVITIDADVIEWIKGAYDYSSSENTGR